MCCRSRSSFWRACRGYPLFARGSFILLVHRANVRSRTRVRALCISLTRIGAARRWRSFFCAMVSTFTLNIFLSGELGDWDQVNTPGLITFGGFQADPYHLWELFVFAAIGVAGGSVPPPSSLVALPPSAPAPQSAALQPAWRAFQWDQPRHLEVSSCSHQHQASASTGRGRTDRLALRGCCVLASERALLECAPMPSLCPSQLDVCRSTRQSASTYRAAVHLLMEAPLGCRNTSVRRLRARLPRRMNRRKQIQHSPSTVGTSAPRACTTTWRH